MKKKILYVEDDDSLAFITKDNLELRGYEVDHISDSTMVIEQFRQVAYDICILDIMLPQIDGFQLAREIKKISSLTPIIFLSAKTLIEDKIEGLEIGADDYMTKPFSVKELVLRIEAILRRSKNTLRVGDEIGDLIFDSENYKVKINQEEFKLTAKECALLRLLAENKGTILKRADILLNIWGSDDFFLGRSLDVFISRIRKILKASSKVSIENIHGVGFRLVDKK